MADANKGKNGKNGGEAKKVLTSEEATALGVSEGNTLEEAMDGEFIEGGASELPVGGAKPIRKINPKDILGDIKGRVMKGELRLPFDAYIVLGRALNILDDVGSYGPWSALIGEFEAQSLLDGTEYFSSKCFIPGPAGDQLIQIVRGFTEEPIAIEHATSKSRKTYKVSGEYVEIALVISVVPNDRPGGAPYQYDVRPLVPVRKTNMLDGLRKHVAKLMAPELLKLEETKKKMLALSAPTAAQ